MDGVPSDTGETGTGELSVVRHSAGGTNVGTVGMSASERCEDVGVTGCDSRLALVWPTLGANVGRTANLSGRGDGSRISTKFKFRMLFWLDSTVCSCAVS
jgi:hypothetical protein